MLIYEYKLDGNQQQDQAIEEAIRLVQFIDLPLLEELQRKEARQKRVSSLSTRQSLR